MTLNDKDEKEMGQDVIRSNRVGREGETGREETRSNRKGKGEVG